mgnify:CR=1 FL=1
MVEFSFVKIRTDDVVEELQVIQLLRKLDQCFLEAVTELDEALVDLLPPLPLSDDVVSPTRPTMVR